MMSDKHFSVQIKRGTQSQLESVPPLLEGELAWITDKKVLYIGTSNGNQVIFNQGDVEDLINNNNSSSLGEILKSWDIELGEFRDLLRNSVVTNFSSVPLLLDNLNDPSDIRTGLVYVDESTKNLPYDFKL